MKQTSYHRNALVLVLLLVLAAVASILSILYTSTQAQNNLPGKQVIADIYQDGGLLQSIPLSAVEESYCFTISGENGATNKIEVRPGSIGIISANCPDKLCVHQGFINNSLLPITCLPNHLVIQIRQDTTISDTLPEHNAPEAPDMITY